MSDALPSAPGVWPLLGRSREIEAGVAALHDVATKVVLIRGESGGGKTRLALECARRFAATHAEIEYAQASEATRVMPLGAVIHLLPTVQSMTDLSELFQLVRDAFARRSGGRVLIVLDDVHLLDDTSATLLTPLLASGVVQLLLTARVEESVSAVVEALWRNQPALVIDLDDLTEQTSIAIMEQALGASVERSSAARLAATSKGNPLYLRELIVGSLESGALIETDGVWRLEGALRATDALVDVVTRRVASLGSEARGALEFLAVGDLVGVADAEDMFGSVLEDLERSGLVRIEVSQRRFDVRLAHPVYREVLRSGLSPLRLRALCLEHVERVVRRGVRRRDDPLRVASLQLDGTGSAGIEVLIRAARLARHAHDFAMVQRLARAALREGNNSMASVLLGEALYETGEFAEAEQVLANAAAVATSERVAIASVRSVNLFWGLLLVEEAIDVATQAANLSSEDLGAGLWAHVASAHLWMGDAPEALRMLAAFAGHDTQYAVAARALTLAPAHNAIGQYAQAVAIADDGFAAHMSIDQPFAIAHPGNHMAAKVLSLSNLGKFSEAEALGRLGYDAATAQRIPIGQMWFSLMIGRSVLARGAISEARGWLVECVSVARSAGQSIGEQLGLSGVALCDALLGDVREAQRRCGELDAGTIPWFRLYDSELTRARAWTALADGRVRDARSMLSAAADRAAELGIIDQQTIALFDLVRLGADDDVLDRFIEVAQRCEGELVATQSRYAQACRNADDSLMFEVSVQFEQLGAYLNAAEASARAGVFAQRRGDSRAATKFDRRTLELRQHIDQAVVTPHLERSVGVVPLTEREREICMLVARGRTSRDIAEELHLSVRTVNNHLQNVFSKLGVSSRDDIADALGIARG